MICTHILWDGAVFAQQCMQKVSLHRLLSTDMRGRIPVGFVEVTDIKIVLLSGHAKLCGKRTENWLSFLFDFFQWL